MTATKPRCYFYRHGDRVLGTVEKYLSPSIPDDQKWRAVSFVNQDDDGRGFPNPYEAEQYLIAQANMIDSTDNPQ